MLHSEGLQENYYRGFNVTYTVNMKFIVHSREALRKKIKLQEACGGIKLMSQGEFLTANHSAFISGEVWVTHFLDLFQESLT